jgi:DNA (cytosine-5)-methyltransferase 1
MGFDFDPAAITSYQLNFYNAKCIVAWAHDFVEISVGDESKVDVLHLSPPCQVFSFAHTVDGKDDEMNTATFFAVVELVKRTRPRVVTLENTSGLAVLHPLWLNTAIQFSRALVSAFGGR